MNAFKMTAVAAALVVTGFAAQNAQAQGYYTPAASYCAPVVRPVVPAYNTNYSIGVYGGQYGTNNWNNNYNYNGYNHHNYSQYNNFNRPAPYFNNTAYRPYSNGVSVWNGPVNNWRY